MERVTRTRQPSVTFSGARVAQTLASSTLSQILSIAQNYLLVPLFLVAWGEEGYGRWVALTALASYLALLDFGGQSFVGNRLAEAFAQQRYDDFRETLRQGFSLFGAISLAMLLTVSGLLLISSFSWTTQDRLVLFWQAALFALAVTGGVLVTSYPSTGRAVRGAASSVLLRFGSIIVFVLALRGNVGMATYSFVTFAAGAGGTLFLAIDLHREVGDLFRPRFSWNDLKNGLRLFQGSLEYWVFSLAGALNLQGIVLVVSAASGSAAVAQFATHRAAASLTTYVGSLLRPALWTEMTFMAARGDMDRLRSVVSLAVRVSTCCAAIAGSAICVAAPLGYTLWTRSKLVLDVPLLLLLVGQAVLSAAWSAASWPLMAANRPRALSRWSIVNGLLTICGAYLCLRAGYGIRSVAAVSLGADCLCALVPIPLAAAAFLNVSAWLFVRDLLRALACALPFALASYFSVRLVDGALMQLASFSVAGLVMAYPALFGLLGARDLARVRATVLKR